MMNWFCLQRCRLDELNKRGRSERFRVKKKEKRKAEKEKRKARKTTAVRAIPWKGWRALDLQLKGWIIDLSRTTDESLEICYDMEGDAQNAWYQAPVLKWFPKGLCRWLTGSRSFVFHKKFFFQHLCQDFLKPLGCITDNYPAAVPDYPWVWYNFLQKGKQLNCFQWLWRGQLCYEAMI